MGVVTEHMMIGQNDLNFKNMETAVLIAQLHILVSLF